MIVPMASRALKETITTIGGWKSSMVDRTLQLGIVFGLVALNLD